MTGITTLPVGPTKSTTRWGVFACAGALALSAASIGSLVAVGGCRQTPPVAAGTSPLPFEAKDLDGKWYIVASDQPTWTSGERTSPALHYKVVAGENGRLELEDRVTFLENGALGEYKGRDTQDPERTSSFDWHGTGVLSLVSTRWHLMHISPDKQWAVTFYERTMATPAGVAILSRTPTLPTAALAEARAVIIDNGELRAHTDNLREVAQAAVVPEGS